MNLVDRIHASVTVECCTFCEAPLELGKCWNPRCWAVTLVIPLPVRLPRRAPSIPTIQRNDPTRHTR